MHSENIAAYVGLDVHKETLRLLLLHLNGLAKFVIMVRLTTKPRLYVDYFRNCRDFTETFFPAMRLAPVVLGYIINSQR